MKLKWTLLSSVQLSIVLSSFRTNSTHGAVVAANSDDVHTSPNDESRASSGGHFLFYLPAVPKSTIFAITPILEALLDRGHRVSLVTMAFNKVPRSDIKVIQVRPDLWPQIKLFPSKTIEFT